MDIELAEILVEALNESGEEARVYEDYSGRGMYGQKTAGIVTESSSALLRAAICNPHCFQDDDGEPLFEDICSFSEDSLGFDTIIY